MAQKIHRYMVHVKHDHGVNWIATYATSKKKAAENVMKAEGCPRRAIININRA